MPKYNTSYCESLLKLIANHGHYSHHVKGQNEFELFKNFYCNVPKTQILEWISTTFVSDYAKDEAQSKKFREEGNKFYQNKQYEQALQSYTKSVSYAPKNSNELGLAFANRSAVLYAAQDFKNSLIDIKNCLGSNYPEELKYKIYLRRINCYVALKYLDAIESISALKEYLKETDSLAPNKIDSILKELAVVEKRLLNRELQCTKKEDCNDGVTILPNLKGGSNDRFLSASNYVDLEFDTATGRRVVANRKLEMGDVIFVEKPFTCVPVVQLDNTSMPSRCYYCFKTTKCPISCTKCRKLYCGEDCFNESWDRFHKWECSGSCIEVWENLGIHYLAMRMVLLGARNGFFEINSFDAPGIQYGDMEDNYPYVLNLATQFDKMSNFHILFHVVSAMVIVTYLQEKTDFFQFLETLCLSPQGSKNYLVFLVGGNLLKHLLQVLVNASTIEYIGEDFGEKLNGCDEMCGDGYNDIGAGIFVSISMMNHSCDTNIVSKFYDDYMVVQVRRTIEKGEEVFNCYGNDFRKESTDERRLSLSKRYYFDCKCTACTHPTKPEMYKDGLSCQKCSGCAVKTGVLFECLDCHHRFSPTNHFVYIAMAKKLYEKYQETRCIKLLKKCKNLREKVFYKHNYNILSLNKVLRNHYDHSVDFENWFKYTKCCLDTDRVILGEDCFQYGVNVRKVMNIIMSCIGSPTWTGMSNKRLNELVSEVARMKAIVQKLFILFYPAHVTNFAKMDERFNKMVSAVLLKQQRTS